MSPVAGRKSLSDDVVIEMEDSRCKIAAIEADDPRCRGLLSGAVIEMEDPRCKDLSKDVMLRGVAAEADDPRCKIMAIEVEDPRCRGLHIW